MYFKKWKDFQKLLEQETINNDEKNKNGTNSTVSVPKLDSKQFQVLLNNWNSYYSQEFKFKNNQPVSVNAENNVDVLISNIADEYKVKVKEGINKLMDIFSDKENISKYDIDEIIIIGYTSTTASNSYNQELSLRRAKIVANAIRNEIKNRKIEIKTIFKEEGMGENPNSLIVLNDQSLDPVQLNSNVPKLSDEIMNLISKSKEERQKMNRRVKITLPKYKTVEAPIKKIDVVVEKKPTVKKPELPDPKSITFNLDSYILTKEGQSILSTFCKELVDYNNSQTEDKIKNIYISSHTMKGKEEDNEQKKKDEIKRDKKLSVLSCNRAKLVEDFIKSKLKSVTEIKFFVYPVAYLMGAEKKVVINFDDSNHMKTAKQEFDKLSSKYEIPKDETGLNIGKYIINDNLKSSILYNIESNIKYGSIHKWIPLELFYDELDNYYGLKRSQTERTEFKKEVEDLIEKSNKKYQQNYTIEDFVYQPD